MRVSPARLGAPFAWRLALSIAGLVCAVQAQAVTCVGSAPLRGVNMAGAEFNPGKHPATAGKDYVYPQASELAYFAGKGMNVIRLPIRWERIQPALLQPLDSAELARIDATVHAAAAQGLCVILDMHNYGVYQRQGIGSREVPITAFTDVWIRLARAFPDADRVAFGLMNEPNLIPIATWAQAAQAAASAIRAAGATNLVLVSGGRWSGAHEWMREFGGTSNAREFAGLRANGGPLAIEVHQYLDGDFSGTHQNCIDPARVAGIMAPVVAWARHNGQRLFLGEFGTPPSESCLAALDALLAQTTDAAVWRGWAYWAAGAWWGPGYPLSIQPLGGQDAAQMDVLRKYLAANADETEKR
ncbi:MAG: glycoside hydrolase family 5 protein [Rhodocyclaceae bacterium]